MMAFIAAESREFSGLERHLSGLERLSRPLDYAVAGKLRGQAVVLAANGPGPRLAGIAVDLLDAGPVSAFVSTGFCGALAPRLNPCDIFVGTSVNGAPLQLPRHSPRGMSHGPLLSMDRVITTVDEKRHLHSSTGADAVEMEAAGVAQRAGTAPFYCVRVVTDTAEEALPLDFNQLRNPEGRFSRAKIVGQVLRRPFPLMSQLIQLDRRCRSAAFALGEFLADCQF